MSIKRSLITVHRWISLAFVVFWLAQVGAGIAVIFHWELNDSLIETSAPSVPTDAAALGDTIMQLTADAGPGWTFASLWATGGTPGRFDIYIENAVLGRDETIRVTGNGTVLRRGPEENWIDTVVTFHHNLLAGDKGSTFVGISGVLLATNIILGLKLAWPGIGGFPRAMSGFRAPAAPAAAYARHRALGLIIGIPALMLIVCGVLMVFEDSVRAALRTAPVLPDAPAVTEPVGPAQILKAAMTRFPDATLAALVPPDADMPFYVVRLRQPDELRRVFGKTTLYLTTSGDIAEVLEPGQGPWARTFVDSLYPLHTGEAGGLAGRLLVMLLGLSLLTLMGFGLRLWWLRRR